MKRERGFTLVELLVVVCIVGILSAIIIPNLRVALSKSKQRRTMSDMRTVALAVSAYATDWVYAPDVAAGTVEDLLPYLTPTYLKSLPGVDGWQRAVRYAGQGLDYTLLSYGRDGIEQGSLTLGPTTDFDDDIIIANGVFVQWPEGVQVE